MYLVYAQQHKIGRILSYLSVIVKKNIQVLTKLAPCIKECDDEMTKKEKKISLSNNMRNEYIYKYNIIALYLPLPYIN